MRADGKRIKCPDCGCKVFKIFKKEEATKAECRNCGHTIGKVVE